ncbi:fumarylacetoacetate hydrolase family protein [Streptomyces sp. NBC_00582]|uniref:fumarylacetoacetate hydrolase family protein n=1 Tax=Streptomyces sp. NBC_00582 TaxID=2975783 RepID=UPI002E8244B0|nr:fumarylacetoacetate hydrolase family protein [Streptomyces sp. NBC_00582]WUB67468.1 fumarylacetoacetate hydrolase family protein [Streptomyces sp. NBC_00582]
MRIASYEGRLTLLVDGGGIDVATATGGSFTPDVLDAIERWDELTEVAAGLRGPVRPVDPARLDAPVRLPRQVFAVGLNYRDHAAEAGIRELPTAPPVFTKFPVCVTGPEATVTLPSTDVDYEAELVVVIGRRAEHIAEGVAWGHVAGLMVGQDLSERKVQLAGPVPQFSLGKSFPGFGPTGPAIVSPDEFADPDALEIGCSVADWVLQSGNTKDMIFPVPELIARLSRVCPLLPGDLIFTGTPAGVGMSHTPPRFLRPGETLTTFVETVGTIHTTFTVGPGHDEAAPEE